MNSRKKPESDRNSSGKQLSTFGAESSQPTAPKLARDPNQQSSQSFEISVSLTSVQINSTKRPQPDQSGAKEDNKQGVFNDEHPAESESFSQDGCEQQNQTSGFAGNDQYRHDQEDYDDEADDQKPDDLKQYPKKADDQPENMTFQGGFEQKQQDDHSEADEADNEVQAVQKESSQNLYQPLHESGRDTADLMTHSEIAKKKRTKEEFVSSLEVKKQSVSDNLNMLSYQTANFGARAKLQESVERQNEPKMQRNQSLEDPEKMFASMSDLNFVEPANSNSKQKESVVEKEEQLNSTWKKLTPLPLGKPSTFQLIISSEQREQMRDTSSNWKVRTSTIDDIHISIQAAIDSDPDQILQQAETLLDFFVSLLADQNFKIVLMTLSIINLVISMPQHLQEEADQKQEKEHGLSTNFLSRCVPRLVSKLSDSKNIIRQQAIRALIGIFLIMRAKAKTNLKTTSQISGQKQSQPGNNFVSLVLPHLHNSSSWHIREELLNVLIICFLKSRNFYEFDAYKVLEALLQMLDDSKDRIRFTALEAIVAFVTIGNKLSAKEVINQLADKQISELISERLEASADMAPYLNENGALEMPYLEHIELAANQMMFGQIQRREGLNSGPAGQVKNLSSHPLHQGKRGSSSGQKGINPVCPPSANSLANTVQNANGGKRTASANNPKDFLQTRVASNAPNTQSPIYQVFGNQNSGHVFSDFNASAASYNPVNKQFSASIRSNQRVNNDRIGSGQSLLLPQLQRKTSVKNGKHETPNHNIMQSTNFYGQSQSPRETIQGVPQRGPPSSENRFLSSHQSEPGSSFYSSNYQKKVSAQNMQNHQLSAPGQLALAGQVSQNSNGSYVLNNNFNQLSNHPIHLLSKENGNGLEFGLGLDESDALNYLGINHPPVQMISHYYQQSNQLNLLHQNFTAQSRVSTSQQNSSLRIQHMPQSYDAQTVSSYYSRKDMPSTDAKSFVSSQLQSSSNNINIPHEGPRPNSNRAVNGSNVGGMSNQAPKSGGSIGEGPLLFTPETRGNSSGLGQIMQGGLTSIGDNPRQQKLFKIGTTGVTFYSDGSMMTATTGATSHAANKLLRGKQMSTGSHPEEMPTTQQWGAGTNTGLVIGNQRGPVKATKQMAVKRQEAPPSVELCIDSRKPKRPLGSESYNDLDDGELEREDMYGQEAERSGEAHSRQEVDDLGKYEQEQDSTILSKTYLSRDELEPIRSSPEKEFQRALNNLAVNIDWNLQFEACNTIRSACKHHQNLLLQNGAAMLTIVKKLSIHAESLRSALTKNVLLTINDMFFYLKRCMDTYLDPLTKVLMRKSADTNEFIIQEAESAIASMCQNCQDQKVLITILSQQVNSKSNQQRLAICKCLEFLVQSLGNNIIFFSNSDKLIAQLANYMSDPCQEVRSVAKRSFLALSHAVMNGKDLERLLLRVLSEGQYKKVKSYLDNEPMTYDHNAALGNFVIKNSTPGTNMGQAHATASSMAQVQPNGVALNQKTINQMRAQGAAKGTLRTGTISGKAASGAQLSSSVSGAALPMANGEPLVQFQQLNGEGQNLNLNIKATAIINPKKIVRVVRNDSGKTISSQNQKPTIKLKGSNGSQISFNSQKSSEQSKSQLQLQETGSFPDQIRDLQQKMMIGDWRNRQEAADSLFFLIESNVARFASSKQSDAADIICKLLTDQNAKIQVSSLERFISLIPSLTAFIESNINLFFGALTSNLASTNTQIRKLNDQAFSKLYESISRQQLLGPLLNAIQFQTNVRLKPQLIDHFSGNLFLNNSLDYICDSCLPAVLSKQALPVAYKLLDDTRSEVKVKAEKLLKKLYFLLGQQVIDLCPSTKLQRVCDIVLNGNGLNAQLKANTPISAAGTAAFGVQLTDKTTDAKMAPV